MDVAFRRPCERPARAARPRALHRAHALPRHREYPDEGSYQQFLQEHGGSSKSAFHGRPRTQLLLRRAAPAPAGGARPLRAVLPLPVVHRVGGGPRAQGGPLGEREEPAVGQAAPQPAVQVDGVEAHPYKFGTGNLHTLRDRPEGRAAVDVALDDSGEVGVHFGITCDGSGVSPIVGRRYKMIDEDYDLCEAVYKQLSADDAAKFELVPPPRAGDPAAERARRGERRPPRHHVRRLRRVPDRRAAVQDEGHDFDLCEEQFAQLDDDDRVKFELVAPPPPPRVKVCIKPDARPAVNVRRSALRLPQAALQRERDAARRRRPRGPRHARGVGRAALRRSPTSTGRSPCGVRRRTPTTRRAARSRWCPSATSARSRSCGRCRRCSRSTVRSHRYLSHLLGHESEGSLLSLLKSRNWVDSLVAGETHVASDFSSSR